MATHRPMTAVSLKAVARFTGGMALAACFVALLSFIFSFLGAIFCAALAGMMLGAVRGYKWLAVPVSLLSPGVLFLLLKVMKTQLEGRQVLLVTLACFMIFWLTYGVAAALFLFERKGPASVARPLAPGQPERQFTIAAASAPEASVLKPNGHLTLEMLQGTWAGESRVNGEGEGRRISIDKERLTLCAVDSRGQTRVLASAHVTLCDAGSPTTLQLAQPPAEPQRSG